MSILNSRSWLNSILVHTGLALIPFVFFVFQLRPEKTRVNIEVFRTSVVETEKALEIAKPQPEQPQKTKSGIFGMNRNSITAAANQSDAIEVKQGQTVAKEFDDLKLKDTDASKLPIPADEFLVSALPRLKENIVIPYPPEARSQGLFGSVVMSLLIDKLGDVREVVLVQGTSPILDQAALTAIRQFKFFPAKIKDEAVAVRIRYTYKFVLEENR